MKSQSSSTTTSTSTSSDSGLSHEQLHAAIRLYLSRVLIILFSLGAGSVNATAQVQTSAYVTNLSGTVSVIDTTTNTVVATIPVSIIMLGGGEREKVTGAAWLLHRHSYVCERTTPSPHGLLNSPRSLLRIHSAASLDYSRFGW